MTNRTPLETRGCFIGGYRYVNIYEFPEVPFYFGIRHRRPSG